MTGPDLAAGVLTAVTARQRDERWRASGVSPMVLLLLGFELVDRKVKSQTN